MVNRLLASLGAAVCAALPLSAQAPEPVYRGDGYEVALPAGCRVDTWRATGPSAEMQPIDCGGRARSMFVTRVRPTGPADSTRATRVVAFESARTGLLQEFGADALGTGTEFTRPDRAGWRMPVRAVPQPGTVLQGIVEISFVRGDSRRMWILVYLDRTPDADAAGAGKRIFNTFRITDLPDQPSGFGGAGSTPANPGNDP